MFMFDYQGLALKNKLVNCRKLSLSHLDTIIHKKCTIVSVLPVNIKIPCIEEKVSDNKFQM